jgi:hypothetical protein
MIDSTGIPVVKGFEPERPKSAVLTTLSTWRPRWTPTSTLSASLFIAQLMTCCQNPQQAPGAWSPTRRSGWGRPRRLPTGPDSRRRRGECVMDDPRIAHHTFQAPEEVSYRVDFPECPCPPGPENDKAPPEAGPF